ncbi:MAG TPA: PIN domain-containing protein [Thermoanaerobaculales bacterium]|nr:PIN domain-containing protein [Thermoanaerobaculales bacterium]HQL29970.1 PIN domain-containing protein [Thermoanaerobaculales bacterium]HQN96853.1 PIN domain-containing protein [Thermoanaerobaculales bacterium]HQP44065.1 PIN domain-containing protein [Thermoanaerobaculales bacterium]
MRLFLDANVLFAAAYSPEGRSAGLFVLAGAGACSLSSSRHAIDECFRNLALKAPQTVAALGRLLELLEVVPEAGPGVVAWAARHGLPANDAPILAAASAAGVDFLVTGDRTHFGHLFGTTVGRVTVVPPSDALVRVLEGRPER